MHRILICDEGDASNVPASDDWHGWTGDQPPQQADADDGDDTDDAEAAEADGDGRDADGDGEDDANGDGSDADAGDGDGGGADSVGGGDMQASLPLDTADLTAFQTKAATRDKAMIYHKATTLRQATNARRSPWFCDFDPATTAPRSVATAATTGENARPSSPRLPLARVPLLAGPKDDNGGRAADIDELLLEFQVTTQRMQALCQRMQATSNKRTAQVERQSIRARSSRPRHRGAEAHALDAARPRAPMRGALPSRRRDGRQPSSLPRGALPLAALPPSRTPPPVAGASGGSHRRPPRLGADPILAANCNCSGDAADVHLHHCTLPSNRLVGSQ